MQPHWRSHSSNDRLTIAIVYLSSGHNMALSFWQGINQVEEHTFGNRYSHIIVDSD